MSEFIDGVRRAIERKKIQIEALEDLIEDHEHHEKPAKPKARPNGAAKRRPVRRRRTALDPLLKAWAAAGEAGMTLDMLASAAKDAGLDLPRVRLRSMVWDRKKKGMARTNGDRHIWIGPAA